MGLDGFGDGVFELVDAFSGDGGDFEEGEFAAFGVGAEFFEFVGVADVGFGGDDNGGFGGEGGVEGAEFFGDGFEVGDGVSAPIRRQIGGPGVRAVGAVVEREAEVGDVDEVDDDAGALDVAEELDAEAGAEVGAFDEAGEVGDGEGLGVGEVADLDDAEVGFEGGEGVVGDFGFGGGESGDEGGFADVGVADEAGVGEEAEFEAVVAGFAGSAEFVLAGGLVGGGGEVLVAASAAAAAGDDDGFVGAGEVVDELVGVVVVEEGADGDVEGDGGAGFAGAVGAHAVLAAAGFVFGVEAEVDEGVVGEGGRHEDVAAVSAVSAGGAAAGNEFFAAEGHAAVAAVAGLDADFCFVDEHVLFSLAGGGRASRLRSGRGGGRGCGGVGGGCNCGIGRRSRNVVRRRGSGCLPTS